MNQFETILGKKTVLDGACPPMTGRFTCRRRLAKLIETMDVEPSMREYAGITRILFEFVKRTFGVNVKVTN
jgi:hypothetical protein